MPEVVNNQRKIQVKCDVYQNFANVLRAAVSEADRVTFTVAFVSDRKMKELNTFFRGKKSTTDVLSFPYQADDFLSEPPVVTGGFLCDSNPPETSGGSDFLGDIVISVEQAQKQAAENGLDLEGEIKQLILHGLLHLCGYDHEIDDGQMNARELELRNKLGI